MEELTRDAFINGKHHTKKRGKIRALVICKKFSDEKGSYTVGPDPEKGDFSSSKGKNTYIFTYIHCESIIDVIWGWKLSNLYYFCKNY